MVGILYILRRDKAFDTEEMCVYIWSGKVCVT